MPGSEFEGWTVGFSLEPNLTGAAARLRAGATIAADGGEGGDEAGAASELAG